MGVGKGTQRTWCDVESSLNLLTTSRVILYPPTPLPLVAQAPQAEPGLQGPYGRSGGLVQISSGEFGMMFQRRRLKKLFNVCRHKKIVLVFSNLLLSKQSKVSGERVSFFNNEKLYKEEIF